MLDELWTKPKAKSVNLQNEKETNVPQQAASQALDREYGLRTIKTSLFRTLWGNESSSK